MRVLSFFPRSHKPHHPCFDTRGSPQHPSQPTTCRSRNPSNYYPDPGPNQLYTLQEPSEAEVRYNAAAVTNTYEVPIKIPSALRRKEPEPRPPTPEEGLIDKFTSLFSA